MMVNSNNVAGHRERLEWLKDRVPEEELYAKFVGGALKDVDRIGYTEREIISRHKSLEGANVIDVGCGIGRLTKYLLPTGVAQYLGTDVVTEVLAKAEALANGRPDYRFALVDGPKIPTNPQWADIVCGFSIITHLLDEEVFRLFHHTRRALKPGGVAVYSYLSFVSHREMFVMNDKTYESKPDVLKFFWPGTLEQFAEDAGLEVIETIECNEDIQGKDETLQNGELAPNPFKFGQCLIYLRRPH